MAFSSGNNSKLSHPLRFAVFLLRLALGLDFLYLGVATIFEPGQNSEFRTRSLGDLYLWLASVSNTTSLQTVFAWAFLIIGTCLILGFMTRIVTVLGIALVVASFVPDITYASFTVTQLVSDGIIVVLCLAILFITNAGTYLGLDHFIHFGKRAE